MHHITPNSIRPLRRYHNFSLFFFKIATVMDMRGTFCDPDPTDRPTRSLEVFITVQNLVGIHAVDIETKQ